MSHQEAGAALSLKRKHENVSGNHAESSTKNMKFSESKDGSGSESLASKSFDGQERVQIRCVPAGSGNHLESPTKNMKLSESTAFDSGERVQIHCVPADITAGVKGVDLFVPDYANFGHSAAAIPAKLIDEINLFIKSGKRISKITGKRSEVHLEGKKSADWKQWVKKRKLQQFNTFVSCLREKIHSLALQAGYKNISMSPDVVALVGAEAEQTPHVDLLPGQVQAIMALTPNAKPTLAYGFNDATVHSPSTKEAFGHLAMDEKSTSTFANILRCAPALGQSRNDLLLGMRPISIDTVTTEERAADMEQHGLLESTNGRRRRRKKKLTSGFLDCMPPSSSSTKSLCMERERGRWSQGTIMLADHKVVHAGPQQDSCPDESPRIVIFTTFLGHIDATASEKKSSEDSKISFYDVSDQYLPYHFCEDPTMPNERVVNLLEEWSQEKPYMAYMDNAQRFACRSLCDSGNLTANQIDNFIKILRSPASGKSAFGIKKKRCKKCANCCRPNCGKCRNCKDMAKFGGPNKIKQSCIFRRCVELGSWGKHSKPIS